ncbi:MAG: hypothetical protein E6J36_21885 [Chloroflexi bacterium]|nr:MAG: hypothetical protein E6J36_21885 [Chloroflexota bacterium]
MTKAGYAKFRTYLLYAEQALADKKTLANVFQDVLPPCAYFIWELQWNSHMYTSPDKAEPMRQAMIQLLS